MLPSPERIGFPMGRLPPPDAACDMASVDIYVYVCVVIESRSTNMVAGNGRYSFKSQPTESITFTMSRDCGRPPSLQLPTNA